MSESFFLDVSISQLCAQKAEVILDSWPAFRDWAIQISQRMPDDCLHNCYAP